MEIYKCTEVNLPCSSCRPSSSGKALKLGVKGKEVDNFVDKLKSEGENIVSSSAGRKASEASKVLQPPVNIERYCLLSLFRDLTHSTPYIVMHTTVQRFAVGKILFYKYFFFLN